MSPLLEATELWKGYPRWQPGTRTLRAVAARRTPLLARGRDLRWALQDVSFTVEAGESFGIVGANGAGKSTLLRLSSGLGRPTRGSVRGPRRTASVLSLGSWFATELSGRENAETAAVVLGWSRREARALVPAVLEFAELEEFAEAPVRVYSDGMRLRLAFGVLAQLQPDLLVIDEALTVGDVVFQEKCVARIREMRAAGTALLLASHDLEQVVNECDRALWLHRGRARSVGEAGEVVAEYREAGRLETLARTPPPHAEAPDLGERRLGSQELTIERVALLGPDGRPTAEVPSGASLTVMLALQPRATGIEAPQVQVQIHRAADDLLCHDASTAGGAARLGPVHDPVSLSLTIDRLHLVPGDYFVTVGVYRQDWEYAYDYRWHLAPLRVGGPPGAHGVLQAHHRWELVATSDALRIAR